MAKNTLPPGFRFHPTDMELVRYYLRRKVMGKRLCIQAVAVLDIYKFSPWELPEKSCLRSRDLQWYFFCPRDRKYAIGPRKNRATEAGYWKTTGKDRSISYNSKILGMKKTLVYHEGRAPKGTRTDWVMHEYRLEDQEVVDAGYSQDAYVLCRIFKKSGPGPKNGEQYGAPFKDEEWDADDEDVEEHHLLPYASSDPGSSSSDDHHLVTSGNDQKEVHDSRAAPAVGVEKVGDELLQEILVVIAGSDAAAASTINESSLVGNKSLQDDDSEIFNNLEDISIKGGWNANDQICIEEENYMTMDDFSFPIEGDFSAVSEIDHATSATAWEEGVQNNQWPL
ncbi:NAC domain-containing protein 82-like isoform X2 [Aristolochia californica]|uniref:NAC domain-containing protein 82-like isoform X2 n=1 Tax=Aristolochia californica TaxID=171875 RepID=UPI0035DCC6EE